MMRSHAVRMFLVAVALIAMLAAPILAQPREARNLMNDIKRALRNRRTTQEDMTRMLQQIQQYPGVEVTKFMVEDVLPGLHPTERPDMGDAYMVAIDTLKAVAQDAESKTYLDEQIFNQKLPGSIRVVPLQSRLAQGATAELITKALEDESWQLRTAALNHISQSGETNAAYFAGVKSSMGHDNFRVRAAALEVLEKYVKNASARSPQQLEALDAMVAQLEKEDTRLKGDIIAALSEVAGGEYGTDATSWKNWLAGYRQGQNPNNNGGAAMTGPPMNYYGIRSYAKKIVFVLDMSSSMEESLDNKEQIRQKLAAQGVGQGINWGSISTKFDLARAELIRAIRALQEPNPDDVPRRPRRDDHQSTVAGGPAHVAAFTIIAYADEVSIWEETLQPATSQNKERAIQWLGGLNTGKLTNIYGALNKAFDLAEGKLEGGSAVMTGGVTAHVDSIFFLTDGYATTGKYHLNGTFSFRETLDTNGDGYLSKEEYNASWATGFLTQERIDGMFTRIDKNNDGRLSEQEFTDSRTDYYGLQMDGMLAELHARNDMLKVQIHTIGIGQHDRRTLQRLAEQNGGQYVGLSQ